MITQPTSSRIFAKIVAESPNLTTQIQREEWVARQRKKRQRSALARVLSCCSGAREVVAAVADQAGGEGIGRNTITHTALGKLLRRLPSKAQLTAEAPVRTPHVINRPAHTLCERHRPSVISALANPAPPPRSLAPLNEILELLDARITTGQHQYSTLDWLHSATGFSWGKCAEILRARDLAVDKGAVAMLTAARNFWDRLHEFQRIYHNAVRLGQVEAAEGDWGIVEAAELDDWLPGLHVPLMHRRSTYLVRVASHGRPLQNLDFHGWPSSLPLFRVPV